MSILSRPEPGVKPNFDVKREARRQCVNVDDQDHLESLGRGVRRDHWGIPRR